MSNKSLPELSLAFHSKRSEKSIMTILFILLILSKVLQLFGLRWPSPPLCAEPFAGAP